MEISPAPGAAATAGANLAGTPGELIWTEADYESRIAHADPAVRSWALGRLGLVSPARAAERARGLILDEDEGIQRAAIEALWCDQSEEGTACLRAAMESARKPSNQFDALRRLLLRGAADGAAIVAISRRLEWRRVIDLWHAYRNGDPAGCRRDLLPLLERKLAPLARDAEEQAELLDVLAVVAELGDLPRLIELLPRSLEVTDSTSTGALPYRASVLDLYLFVEEAPTGEIRTELARIALAAGQTIDAVFHDSEWLAALAALRARDHRRAIAIATRGVSDSPPALPTISAFTIALLEALAHTRRPTEVHAALAIALRLGLARQRLVAGTIASGAMTPMIALVEAVGDHEANVLGEAIGARWREADAGAREVATSELLGRLGQEGGNPGELLCIAAELPGFPLADAFAITLDRKGDDDVLEPLTGALVKRPEILRDLAARRLRGEDTVATAFLLDALAEQPYTWATRLVLDRLDALLGAGLAEGVWDLFEEIGDPAALDAAVREWRPNEPRISAVACFLARVADRIDAVPRAILDEDARERERTEGLMRMLKESIQRDPTRIPAPPLSPLLLALRCGACGRIYHYDVHQALVHPDLEACRAEGWDGVLLSRVIRCKRCGAQDNYSLTARAHAVLLSHTMHLAGKKAPQDLGGPVVMAAGRLWDGTIARRASHALRHLRDRTTAEPANAEAWRRLGSSAERYGERAEAEAAFRRALELKDKDVESAHSLALICLDDGRLVESFGYARAVLRGVSHCNAVPELRTAMALEALETGLRIVTATGEPLALMVAWETGADPRQPTVNVSSVDLRKAGNLDALATLLANPKTLSADFTAELPTEEPTQLQRLAQSEQRPAMRATAKVGRNDPCSCGSGKKYKKCCGAPGR